MNKSEITLNGINLQIYSNDNSVDNKRYIDVYTSNSKNKMFIHESLKTGKNLRISVHIDGSVFQLSEKYDYGRVLDVFTNLLNKLSNN
jgi:hypothetical protein